MKQENLIAGAWADYELLDSGDNRKLERYGEHILIRPETQALWQPLRPELWKKAKAEFRFNEGKGAWRNAGVLESWQLSWNDIRFTARLTSFKHTGIFPEQTPNWEWLMECVKKLKEPQMLNLFGYTGLASIAAALSGARVTHVDASKQSTAWAKENAMLSGIPEGNIRYILDDALRFAEREARRGSKYDGIILDPPAFGRGAKGEVWKIEENLPRLLAAVQKVFSATPGAFFLLNGYAAGYSPQSFLQAVENFFPGAKGEFGLPAVAFGASRWQAGELQIEESGSGRGIPSGIYVRFVR